ncbi:MAG: hypothetical protein WC489_06650 [Patescibacteria group bacterium]
MSLSKKSKYTFKKIRPIILQLILILFLAGGAYVTAGTISRRLPSIFPSPTPTITPIPTITVTPTLTPTPTNTPTPTPVPRIALKLWGGTYLCRIDKSDLVKNLSDQYGTAALKYQACVKEKQSGMFDGLKDCIKACHDNGCSDACATNFNNRLRQTEQECKGAHLDSQLQNTYDSARYAYCVHN